MVPGDRLVCAFVEPLTPGAVFAEWPLHVTVVPWFRVDIPTDRLVSLLSSTLSSVHAFDASADGTAHFGRGGKKLVHLIAAPSPFWDVEHRIRELLHRQQAWIVDETTRKRRTYQPHITNQQGTQAHDGQAVQVNNLYIIEQQGSHKVVAGKVALAL